MPYPSQHTREIPNLAQNAGITPQLVEHHLQLRKMRFHIPLFLSLTILWLLFYLRLLALLQEPYGLVYIFYLQNTHIRDTSYVFFCIPRVKHRKLLITRVDLTSVLGPFGVHLVKFILPTPVHFIDAFFGVRMPFQSSI